MILDSKVLILGAATVQKDAVIEFKKLGCEVHVCAREFGPASIVADFFECIDILDISSIEEYVIKHNIKCVYSVGSDLAMPVCTKISEKLNIPRFVSSETAITCNNKGLMRKVLGKDFVGNIPSIIAKEIVEIDYNEILDYIGLPLILKPIDSQGQRGVYLIDEIADIEKYFYESKKFSKSGNIIIEKYIGGYEISVNGYLVDGELVFCEISDRETWNDFTGLIKKHIVPFKEKLTNVSSKIKNILEQASEKLSIKNGPIYAQMKVENDNAFIIEITPRLDGCHMWKLLKYHTGVNLLELLIKHLLVGDTSELKNYTNKNELMELEFYCQPPGTIVDYSDMDILVDTLSRDKYYSNGEIVKELNGKMEKIGYFIRG